MSSSRPLLMAFKPLCCCEAEFCVVRKWAIARSGHSYCGTPWGHTLRTRLSLSPTNPGLQGSLHGRRSCQERIRRIVLHASGEGVSKTSLCFTSGGAQQTSTAAAPPLNLYGRVPRTGNHVGLESASTPVYRVAAVLFRMLMLTQGMRWIDDKGRNSFPRAVLAATKIG